MFARRLAVPLLIALPLYGACSITYLGTSDQVSTDIEAASTPPRAQLAPHPARTPEAVVQVYGARVAQWHGYFGVHTWIAVKRSHADHYIVHEVTRSQLLESGSAILTHTREPDELWYGNAPELLKDVRGSGTEAVIDKIEAAVARYPFADRYRIWPGPNSNTFVAFVLREVPELRADLPATAVGKDYFGPLPFARTPSGTGGQFNVLGVAGIAAGWEEGVELNLFGLTLGIDPNDLALKVPLLGRVGPKRDQEPFIIDVATPETSKTSRSSSALK
jgi:hypothetical protein